MTDDKDPYIAVPIKEYVDKEIQNLKEILITKLESIEKGIALAHKDYLWLIGIAVLILIGVVAHFRK